jgi:pentatricopeptide repeat domain-containing protein 1
VVSDHLSFSAALGCCAKLGKWGTAERIMHVMAARGVPVGVDCFAVLLAPCESKKDGRKALELLATMDRRGVRPNDLVMRIVLRALASDGRWVEAIEVMDTMQADRGLDPDSGSLFRIASACESAGALDQAEILLAMAKDAEKREAQTEGEAVKQGSTRSKGRAPPALVGSPFGEVRTTDDAPLM